MYSISLLMLVTIFAIGLGLAGGVLLKSAWTWTKRLENDRGQLGQQVEDLEADVETLKAEITELRAAGPKRHTRNMEAALEDALSIAVDALKEYESSRKYTEARIGQLYNALRTAREGPHAYPTDKAAGQRPSRRHDGYES